MEFRKLRADEIECRVGSVKEGKGFSLLLYKDARADMNLLDESGVLWQRNHKELKGVIYGGVGVFNEKLNQWIWKWDAGAESYSDKEKGEASDSFKRACVNLGIGRELYTAPFIWITGYNKYERFTVTQIEYDNGRITNLTIVDSKGKVAFSTNGNVSNQKQETKTQEEKSDKICSVCDGTMTIKSGVGKTGKPYKMSKCDICGETEWL